MISVDERGGREGGREGGRTFCMTSDPTAPRDIQPILLPRAQAWVSPMALRKGPRKRARTASHMEGGMEEGLEEVEEEET